MKTSPLALLALPVLLLFSGNNAAAQTAFNPASALSVSLRVMNVAPDMGDGEGSEVTGYQGCVRCGSVAANREGGMSKEEVDAFLNSPRNWFRAVGGGGSATAKAVKLDSFAKVLSDADQHRYQQMFEAIQAGKFHEIAATSAQLEDKVLLGHVEAAMYLRPDHRTSYVQLKTWLEKHADHPEADDIYALAKKKPDADLASLPKPVQERAFGGSVERADGGGTIEWNAKGILTAASKEKSGAVFARLLRQGKLNEAMDKLDAEPPVVVRQESIMAVPTAQPAGEDETATVEPAEPAVVEKIIVTTTEKPSLQSQAGALAIAEVLMRRGQAARAWPLIKEVDVSTLGLDADAKAYALWLKGLIAWTQDDFDAAYASFLPLSEQPLPGPNRAAAAFWAARSAEKLGKPVEMKRLLGMAADHPRSFYGVLARMRNNQPPEYNWALPSFTKATAEAFKQEPGGKRALALLQLNQRLLAEAELRALPVRSKPTLKSGLLALAGRYNMPGLSVQVGSAMSASGRSQDGALYPLIPWQPEGGYTSDPALVLAIAKNESHFNHVAVSHAGATGLMQIMPRTAESMESGASKNLYDPQYNVTLGDRYLSMLARTDDIDTNLLFIIGSYNAGPKRILQLYNAAKAQNGDDPLLFIETLPIKETRDYMQKVMATYWVYRARFNQPLSAMAELTVGRWPVYRRGEAKLTMNTAASED
jgi:soluble lytic murein transglycosylase